MNVELKKDHDRFIKIIGEATELRWQKLNDYGKTYDSYGIISILVKIEDKSKRIKNIYAKEQNFEPMRDSFIDLANYCIMGVMILDKQKNDNRKQR